MRVSKVWCQPIVAKNSLDRFQKKLKKVKNDLKGWGANVRGQSIPRKKNLVNELSELEAVEETAFLSAGQMRRRSEIQRDLLDLLAEEEEFWRQRAAETWLLKGDNNTEFFHRIANGRKRKKTIFSLRNNADIIQGTPDLLNHATNFYKNLFGPTTIPAFKMDDNVWEFGEKLSDEDKEEIDKSFSEEEIKTAIEQMEKNKAPGQDGFPIEFYQACWSIIKDDLLRVFDDFHSHMIVLSSINYGIITLIPKTEDADIIQKFRPICLLQVLFKIITKVMTNRMEGVVQKIIHPCQSAFIKGRYIHDSVALLQEILRDAKVSKLPGVVL